MHLRNVAEETLAVIRDGRYITHTGARVDLVEDIAAATRGTVLHRGDDVTALVEHMRQQVPAATRHGPKIDVTDESTAVATRRLVQREGAAHVVALNFASAVNPGGGFLNGAKAQEEDLARCSSLYACLLTQPAFYDENRAFRSPLYLDHILYAPSVPFFRDDTLTLVDHPWRVSIVTAPAPNATRLPRDDVDAQRELLPTLQRRAAQVLAVCALHGHRTLVLGAWGCGAFGNNAVDVARVFATCLAEPAFAHAFDHVVFAILDHTPGRRTLAAFQQRFAQEPPART